jgi:hypothetical protein
MNQARNAHKQMLAAASAIQALVLPAGSNAAAVQARLNLLAKNAAGLMLAAQGYAQFLATADGATSPFPTSGLTSTIANGALLVAGAVSLYGLTFTVNADGQTVIVSGTGIVPTPAAS